jgi:hypothetical protein
MVAARTGLLALRVRTQKLRPMLAAGLPRNLSSDRRRCPRLQLRGSAGFTPASQFPSERTEMREPNLKELKKRVQEI